MEVMLPVSGRLMQDPWSGTTARSVETFALRVPDGVIRTALQYPGLLVFDPATRAFALNFGPRGRLRTGAGVTPAVPVAEFGGDLARLHRIANDLQYDGAQPFTVSRSTDQVAPFPQAADSGRTIRVTLGTATATAMLLEQTATRIAPAFAKHLPAVGFATNTYSSGPLTRFWNEKGGPEGETGLDLPEPCPDPTHRVLIPGHLYYHEQPGWRGVRIVTRDPAAMGMQGGGEPLALYPFARFDDPFSAFSAEAARLGLEGKKPMRFELAST